MVALCTLPAAGSAAAVQGRAQVFTGYGFDTCGAPSAAALSAWAASPYRAIGIYLGGRNRACPDGNLSAAWVASAEAAGWALAPLYVGLQAPCVTQAGLTLIDPEGAVAEGVAAADDAATRAAAFALPPGSPIYFDMEGYATNDPGCSQVVQAFLAAWVGELRARGYLAGVYGSAASTIRDIAAEASSPDAVLPDAVWIARWDGQAAVFGDPDVPDTLWADHQRIHQFRGGHNERYGGVTLNIDGNYLDGPVVAAIAPAPPPPPPPPSPGAPAGFVGSGDGEATVSWPQGAFSEPVLVTLIPTPFTRPVPGYEGGYAVRLAVIQTATGNPLSSFAAPLTIRLRPIGAPAVPAYSADGVTWHVLPRLATAALPAGVTAGYTVEADGSTDILTITPGLFGLLRDTTPPTPPSEISGRFLHGSLVLSWHPASDNSGSIGAYEITFDGRPLFSVPGKTRHATLHTFHPDAPSVYRILAVDAAGNSSAPSKPMVVVPARHPAGVPERVPAWAWRLFAWQQHHHAGQRPATPRPLPAWYWHWAAWRLQPFRLRG